MSAVLGQDGASKRFPVSAGILDAPGLYISNITSGDSDPKRFGLCDCFQKGIFFPVEPKLEKSDLYLQTAVY